MNRTIPEIIGEVKTQTGDYLREQISKHPPERHDVKTLEELDDEMERLKREYPESYKRVAIYALVESYSDQAELLRLCKYCADRYLCCMYDLENSLYVDTDVHGNEHPPNWVRLLEDIEKGVRIYGNQYKIEVLCMFQASPGIEDFCRQHNVKLVIPR